ncbi:MAG TPA: hypothetical protein VK599_06015, partial [Streptosporangiaceae bacterium]|nr:hypothetical protein [Streptosporangiaceae bacterium]
MATSVSAPTSTPAPARIGGGSGAGAESAFATVLVPGVVGISVMFQGVQSIALNMAQEFGFT